MTQKTDPKLVPDNFFDEHEPQALPVRVEVRPTAHVDVAVSGPGGLHAILHIPDTEEAYEALPAFAAALAPAIEEGLTASKTQEDSGA